jgi:hypothetical protein
MDEQDVAGRLSKIKFHAAAITDEADALLAAMEDGNPGPNPEPPDQIVDPPSTQHVYLDPIWGGPIGSKGRRVVEGDKCEWKGKAPQWSENTDYINPKLWACKSDELGFVGDRIPTGVRLFNPIFENIVCSDHFFYINHGHDEEKNIIDFVIFGGVSRNVKAKKTWGEFKASRLLIEDHVVDEGCSFGQYLRQRHGRQLVMVGGRGKGEIATRGWAHYVDVPGATGQLWSGNLPAKSKDWIPEKDKGGGAYQCSELCYMSERLKKVTVGQESTKKDDWPAKNNLVHPDVRDVDMKNEDGTKREAIGGWRDLWRKAGLL